MKTIITTKTKGLMALSPMMVFLILYVAVSALIGDFYRIPISVALLVASMWAILIYRGIPLKERIETFSKAAANSDIIYMIWIFVLAGAFASVAKSIGAVDATVTFTLNILPPQYIVPTLFVAACLISFSIGTSVGTVVALTPLAAQLAATEGGNVPFFVGVVLGGAFFGDNLSFISDTTIAATRSQGCSMQDKFKVNLWIALPAAIVTLACYLLLVPEVPVSDVPESGDPWLMLPYLVVIATAVMGVNVTLVLTAGIFTAVCLGLFYGVGLLDMAGFAGAGIDGMGDLIIITLLASGMLGVIKACGGIDYILRVMTARISGLRGAQATLAVLVGIVNLCTANNTVAIITVGGLAKDISRRFGVDPRKSASILDSASCVVQCLIPYGAQTLLATSLAGISPAAPFPYLYYPWAVALTLVLSIVFLFPRRYSRRKD
ncbi:MAG: Na+/H+ antiporter NhaC family protein [Muribaculaceae bacterium]|nr:Na+/H+ antiporter NhaC family protein [Muribaculaceae bacterium]MDE6855380.1 Na+/H+ antiporter NhaC family protein [Muribaculaceae bacterium]